jgi:osmotically inducible lipoprotein OsmB
MILTLGRGTVMLRSATVIAAAGLLLAACGETRLDRGLSGAAIGAGVGAVASAATGGKLGRGVLVGAALGASVGVLTDKVQIDLGEPVWRRGPRPLLPPS